LILLVISLHLQEYQILKVSSSTLDSCHLGPIYATIATRSIALGHIVMLHTLPRLSSTIFRMKKMATIRDSMVNFHQTAQEWFKKLSSHGRKWIMTNREHWAMGFMLGLSAPTSIFIGNQEIPTIISVGYLFSHLQYGSR
jgi:hypothetical protein